MPETNSRKEYLCGAYYHIYNRGAGKREIFLNIDDYKCFLRMMNKLLSPTIRTYDHLTGSPSDVPNKLNLYKYLLLLFERSRELFFIRHSGLDPESRILKQRS